jgi:asparagine synthase (glutamine-hydrolysing)
MCGITGVLGSGIAELRSHLGSMADSLRHRGPDAGDIWMDANAGIGLAHRRLSILDLSPHGAQPMTSASGRFVLCYNGEIYNHNELRVSLNAKNAISWRGHSDTEVLLEAVDCWGVRDALERCNGMFAFAVWDRLEHKLTIARDRLGEKPLYVGWIGGRLAFASELKALRRLPDWQHNIDRRALALLLRFGYVPAPFSIYPNVFKLPSASFATFGLEDASSPFDLQTFTARCERYWSLSDVAIMGTTEPFQGDVNEAVDELQGLLGDAVRLRMEADVPVGAMLSGGIDSSLITALMQQNSSRPVRTFTIGFHEENFDEAPHARKIANHLGTDHTEFHLEPSHALSTIPQLPDIYDEPFADPSQIPTILVSAIARSHVTVALSGDGGDELFFGYGRYLDALQIWGRIGDWSPRTRSVLAKATETIGDVFKGPRRLGFRLARLGRRVNANSFDAYYGNLLSLALTPTAEQHWLSGLPGFPILADVPSGLEHPSERMMFIDQSLYLPEDILTKVDRASMASSLEMRVPLLDPRVVAFAWRLPDDMRFAQGVGKVLLRQLLYRHVPRELVERPKQGFSIPLDEWLRGPLREWMGDLLNPLQMEADGYLDVNAVKKLVAEHLSGCADHGYSLWPVLMFQAWQRHYQ